MSDMLQREKSHRFILHSATIGACNMLCGKGQVRTQHLGYISGALWPLRYTPSCYMYCTCLTLSAPWTSKSLRSAGRWRLSNRKAWNSYRKAWKSYIPGGIGGVRALEDHPEQEGHRTHPREPLPMQPNTGIQCIIMEWNAIQCIICIMHIKRKMCIISCYKFVE